MVIDFENLSIQRHYYWPGIEALKDVSFPYREKFSRGPIFAVFTVDS